MSAPMIASTLTATTLTATTVTSVTAASATAAAVNQSGQAPAAAGQAGLTSDGLSNRPSYRLTFVRLVRSEFYKLTTLKSTWWLLAVNLILLPGSAAITAGVIRSGPSHVATPSQTTLLTGLLGLLQISVILVAILGILAYTGEVSSNTIQGSYAADPGRSGLFFGKVIAVFCLTALSGLAGSLLGWAAAEGIMAGRSVKPLPADLSIRLPLVVVVGTAVVLGLAAVLGVGLGALLRSTVAAVLVLLGLLLLLPLIMGILGTASSLPWAFTGMYSLPESAAENFLNAGSSGLAGAVSQQAVPALGKAWVPSWWQSGLIFLAWVIVIDLLGWLVSRRRDLK